MNKMRQIIKTNSNFITGEHYEQRMLKPVQQAHNRVTVQLCDAATGKVIEEAVTENAITSFFESSSYGTIAKSLNANVDMNGNCEYPLFNTIVLSDSDIGELEDPYFIHGNVVGMCTRDDAGGIGSHKQRGMYNTAESYARIEENCYKHIHLVYDWPTSSGNGKIQNIYWLPLDTDYANPCRTLYTIQKTTGAYGGTDVVFNKRGDLLCYSNSKYYKILNPLKFLNGIEAAKIASEPSFHNDYEVNGHYYAFKYTSTGANSTSFAATFIIEKYDTEGNLVDTWNEDMVSGVPQLVELKNNAKLQEFHIAAQTYCDYDGWVGFEIYYHTTSYNNLLPKRNDAGELVPNYIDYVYVYSLYNVLTKQWLRMPSPWDVWCTYEHCVNYKVLRKIDDKHITREGWYIFVDQNAADVQMEEYAAAPGSPGNKYSNFYPKSIHPTLPLSIFEGSNKQGFGVIRPLSAQTRLASPITKTSLNTMKIQYDFFFKIPLPYMPPDHVWDLYKE